MDIISICDLLDAFVGTTRLHRAEGSPATAPSDRNQGSARSARESLLLIPIGSRSAYRLLQCATFVGTTRGPLFAATLPWPLAGSAPPLLLSLVPPLR